jgi:hypothetical protein
MPSTVDTVQYCHLTFSIALITTEIVTLLTQACLMIIAEEQVETMPDYM